MSIKTVRINKSKKINLKINPKYKQGIRWKVKQLGLELAPDGMPVPRVGA